jgi:CheY-like chemotaxis protein
MTVAHPGRILVVDNDPDFRRSAQVLLKARGYTVFSAANQDQAMRIASRERVHVAVLDIRLESDPDHDDTSGLRLAEELDPLIVKIMLSAYPSFETARSTLGNALALAYVDKAECPDGLLEALEKAFSEKVKINFDLSIGWQGMDLDEVAHEIELESKPALAVLKEEVEEVLRKLFYESEKILVTQLIPSDRIHSTSQSGAVLMRVQPHENSWGPPTVVKLATRGMIATESENYKQFVDQRIGAFRYTGLRRVTETHLLGGIIYTLVGTPLEECVDLGTFYTQHSAEETVEVIKSLFRICQPWYDNRKPRQTHDIVDLYARPLKLSVERLEAALAKAGTSEWTSGHGKRHKIPGLKGRYVNPIEWLRGHPSLPAWTSLCSTHGDMHSRNVLVDQNRQAWLIDFYRTGPGHLYRDLIELESDVKFTLLDVTDLPSLLRFELALLSADHFNDAPTIPSFEEPELKKAFRVVQGIRHIAGGLADPGADMLDYYQGLLLQTLAMIRLRHVTPSKKQHAYLAAALLFERLEEW